MTGEGRLRFLVLSVLGLAALMLAAARWAGHGSLPWRGSPEDAAGPPDGEDAAAGSVDMDLSFYKKLGVPRARGAEKDLLQADPREDGDAAGAYVVQALVTRSRDRARRLSDRLRAKGMQAAVIEGNVGGEVIYRVRVGRYRDREVAEIVARRIRETEDLDPWVLQEAR